MSSTEQQRQLLTIIRDTAQKALNELDGQKSLGNVAKDIDALPWKKNQYGEWVFANIPEARELVAKIGTAKSWTDVDGWEYSLSGEGKKFLNRKRGNAR